MRIRKATQQDLHSIMQLYENARAFMREHGNPGQWGTTYPPQNMIETDIRFGNLYVCIEKDTIEAVFFYKDGIDPTYLKIYDGQWKNDAPYGVVHRITSSGKVKGAASFCLDWAFFTMWKFKDRYARKQYRYAEYAEEKRIYLLRTHLYRQWRRTACIPKRLPSTLRSLLKLFF